MFQTRTSRRALAVIAAALLLAAAACGSDGDDSSADATTTTASDSSSDDSTTTTAEPDEEETTTTTVAESTTTEAADPLAAARALAEAAVGDYSGTWTNTTFGSTGPMTMTVAVEGDEIVLDVDLGGFVFGQSDPEPETYRIPLTATGDASFETTVFGTVSVSVDAATGATTMTADAVPAAGIATFTSTISPVGADSFEGTYVVGFDGGDTAEGVVEYSRG